MSIRVVRLGTPRVRDEGIRIGTCRRPPRGVPKEEYSSHDWYDVWYPNVAPSLDAMKIAHAAETPAQWAAFFRKYRSEMNVPERKHDLALLAALSQTTNFSVGCYCENEEHCHRKALKELLIENGAKVES